MLLQQKKDMWDSFGNLFAENPHASVWQEAEQESSV